MLKKLENQEEIKEFKIIKSRISILCKIFWLIKYLTFTNYFFISLFYKLNMV